MQEPLAAQSIHKAFEAWAVARPFAPALVGPEGELSYEELNRRANKLARVLQRRGVGTGAFVAICLPRGTDALIAILAVLKCGAAYVPLDPELPDQRTEVIVSQAMPSHVIVSGEEPAFLALPSQVVGLFLIQSDLAAEAGTNLSESTCSDSSAYVIFTSGSTGIPKGVVVRHGAVLNMARAQRRVFGVGEQSRVLQFFSFSFDASVFEIFMALLNGAALVLPHRDVLMDSERLQELLRAERITSIQLPPPVLSTLTNRDLPALESVLVGGETYPHQTVARWRETHRVFNVYGPTEATVWATFHEFSADNSKDEIAVIGRPIENVKTYVLDDRLEPVPMGEVGELFIGGMGVAAGYVNRPALTAERFVLDPFRGDGARMYKTGDLAAVLPDGNIRFHGRRDRQLKVRGFRIELDEIEMCLSRHPGVREIAVEPIYDSESVIGTVAYIVPSVPEAMLGEQLWAFAQAQLPGYMVPAAMRIVAELPRTGSNKIDRTALARTAAGNARPLQTRVSLEGLVATHWETVLGSPPASLDEDFVRAGGNSIAAARLLARLRTDLGVTLSLSDFMAAASVRGICKALAHAAMSRVRGVDTLPPDKVTAAQGIVDNAVSDVVAEWQLTDELRALSDPQRQALLDFLTGASPWRVVTSPSVETTTAAAVSPLAPMQHRLWLLAQLEPQSCAYNIGFRILIQGRCDLNALDKALSAAVSRHPVLSATIVAGKLKGGAAGPRPQRILFEQDHDAAHQAASAFRVSEVRRPIDLAAGPLFRAHILVLGDAVEIFFVAHHIVFDGWSVGVLSDDLSSFYAAYASGGSPSLTPVTPSYFDYANESVALLASPQGDELRRFWAGKLEGDLAELRFHGQVALGAESSTSAQRIGVRLGKALSAQVRTLAAELGVTAIAILLAAYRVLLHRYSGVDASGDLLIGTVSAGRTDVRHEPLIGFFVNTLPLRIPVDAKSAFRQVATRAFRELVEAQDHQALPFDEMLAAASLGREGGVPVQAMFVFQSAPMHAPTLQGARTSIDEVPTGAAKFDLHLELRDAGGAYDGWLEFRTDVIGEAIAAQLVQDFKALCAFACAEPDRPVGTLRIQPSAESACYAIASKGDDIDWGDVGWLPQLFAAQVKKSPDAVALTFEGVSLSYRDLDRRAANLASKLKAFGVGPNRIVAVMMERSVELVVSLLAVLQAGGAYVPIDPDHPPERRRSVLKDCEPAAVLCVRALADGLDETATPVLLVDAIDESPNGGHIEVVDVPLRGTDLAYVIFTSGSTGAPKGAMNTHAGLRNRLLWMQRRYGLSPGSDVVLQKTPYTFDVSVWEFFWPLVTGARLVLARPGGHRDHAYLARLVAKERVTTLHFVPSVLRLFLDEPRTHRSPALRRVICSGEELGADLVDRFFDTFPSVELHNLYGPSEAAIDVSAYQCQPPDAADKIPIGRAIDNIRLYLLDGELQPVPTGVAGHLYIAGVGVGSGYVARPELTQESFLPDPFDAQSGSRMYRTGDIAFSRPDGNLVYLGRADAQIKLHGQRVELGEIESVLRRFDGVSDAVVVALDLGQETARLVAYLLPGQGQPPVVVSTLASALRDVLPAYMVPSSFEVVQALPYTTSGKIDRKRLLQGRQPVPATKPPAGERLRGEVAARVAAIWEMLFGVSSLGPDDDFFQLGGNSLLATRMVLKLREEFKLEIPVRTLFDFPSIAGVARAIEAVGSRASDASSSEMALDLELDARLPADVVSRQAFRLHPAERVFLTGATGFLGSFLLNELLTRTGADVHCLVRAGSTDIGFARIKTVMSKYGIWDERFTLRIKVVIGDLARPRLGLTTEAHDWLSRHVDAIYHCGAWVNFIEPYRRLRGPNVQSAEEILRLASFGRPKAVHLISSSSVFGTIGFTKGVKFLREDDDIRMAVGCHYGGYVKSKWAAEWLAHQAAARGLPVTVYRCGLIMGHSDTGMTNLRDFPSLLIKGCIQLGTIYRLRNKLDNFVPVDFAAKAIVQLSRIADSAGQSYHIVNPHHIDYSEFWSLVRDEGYPIAEIGYDDWVAEFLGDPMRRDENALYPLLPLFIEKLPPLGLSVVELFQDVPIYGTELVERGLRGSGITCPRIDRRLVSTWIKYYRRAGFIPEPKVDSLVLQEG